MRPRTLTLAVLGAVLAVGAASPAFADYDDWRRHEWREHAWRERAWREHEWREHEWREHAWREHEWRERHQLYYYRPPVVVAPVYPPYYGY